MKKNKVHVVVIALIVLFLCFVQGAGPLPGDGRPVVNNFVVYDVTGKRHIFYNLTRTLTQKGIIMINFTSVKCLPCRKEIPELLSLKKSHNGNVSLMCIYSESGSEVENLADKLGVLDCAYVDPFGSIRKQFNIKSIPTTILVNKQNTILGRFEEYTPKNMDAIRKLVK